MARGSLRAHSHAMYGETLSIHFHLPATDALGRKHVDGKLRCLDDKVALQFKVRERTFKTTDNELQTIEFPYREVEEVKYVRRWFRRRLVLRTGDAAILEPLPGSHLGRIEFEVDKKSRKDAARIESFVDFKKSEALAQDSHERMEKSKKGGGED